MRFYLIKSALVFALIPSLMRAETGTTDPVGAMQLRFQAQSDTIFGLGMTRSPVAKETIASIDGNTITVQGNPGWPSDQFVRDPGTQEDTLYVQLLSGEREGMYYTITANSADTLTVDSAGDNLSVITSADTIQIVPYWTFDTLFPGQEGILQTISIAGAGSPSYVMTNPPGTAGTNLSSSHAYYYYSGSSFGGPGWRRVGGGFTAIRDHDVIVPDNYLIYRNHTDDDVMFVTAGAVRMMGNRTVVGTLAENTDQDNLVAITVPVDVSLSESKLYEEGIIAGTISPSGAFAEELLTFDNSASGFNKSVSSSYYYYTGSLFGGPGWRKKGGLVIRDDEDALKAGEGFIIRKVSQGPANSDFWFFKPNYLE